MNQPIVILVVGFFILIATHQYTEYVDNVQYGECDER